MDFTAPVSKFMTQKLVTVVPGDKMSVVKEIFDTQRIHHKTDFMHFLRGIELTPYDKLVENCRMHHYTVEDIMTTGIATLESSERLNVALQIFAENLFHAIPIVDNGELVGMITTFDIIRMLVEEDNARIKAS